MPNNIAIGWEELLSDAEKENPELIANSQLTVAPEGPVVVTRDENGIITSFLYGDIDRLMAGDMVNIWNEELIRNPETKKVIGVRTTRTNGTMLEEMFQYDENGKFIGTKMNYNLEDQNNGGDIS